MLFRSPLATEFCLISQNLANRPLVSRDSDFEGGIFLQLYPLMCDGYRGPFRVEQRVALSEVVDDRLALLQEHDLLRDLGEGGAVRRAAGVEFGGES